MADDYIISYSDLIGDDGTFDQLTADLKKLRKELLDLAKVSRKAMDSLKPDDTAGIEKATKEVKEYEQGLKNVIKTEKVLQQTKKKTIDLTQEELVAREALKLEQKERVQRAKITARIAKEEKQTIEKLRAQLSEVTLDWKKLTIEEANNSDEGRKLVKQKLELTKALKKVEEATGDHRRSVGNYGKALNRLNGISKKVRKTLIGLFVGRNIISGIQRIGGAFKGLVDDFRGSNDVIAGVGKSFDKVTGALQFAGVKVLEFLAPAIEYVANLLSKLPAVFAGIAAGASQFGTNVGATFKKLGLSIELVFAKINRNNPFSDQNAEQIEANIRRVERAIQAQTDAQGGVAEAYKEAYDAVIKEQEEFINKQAEIDKAAFDKKAKEDRKRIRDAEQKKIEIRIKAIAEFQKQLENAEAQNIKDAQEKALALEDLRFKEETKLREKQVKELEALSKKRGEDLAKIQKINDDLEKEQLIAHEQSKLDIRKSFYKQLSTEEIAPIGLEDNSNAEQEALINEKVELVEDGNKRIEESNDELFNNISANAQKVGELVTKLFEKQADLSQENVEKQVDNLDRARDRAAQGLETNLAFEEKELAKRQAEQQRKQKEAEQASRILALFNLVSAYAAGGDSNALSRGLVDWSLMTAFAEGFEEGGYTGDDGQKAIAGVVHGQEFVVTARDTARFNLKGKSGDEFGEAMSDYYAAQSPVTQNYYPEQREAFKQGIKVKTEGSGDVVKAVNRLEKQMASQPNYSAQIVKSQEDVISLMISEQKKGMRKLYTKIMRAKK